MEKEKENEGFTVVYDWFNEYDMSAEEKIVFGVIYGWYRSGKECSEKRETLAKRASCSMSTLVRVIHRLEDKRYIKVIRYVGLPSTYIPLIRNPFQNDTTPCQNDTTPISECNGWGVSECNGGGVEMTPNNIDNNNTYRISDIDIHNIGARAKHKGDQTLFDGSQDPVADATRRFLAGED